MTTGLLQNGISSKQSVTRRRYEAGDYVNGRWVEGASTDTEITCSVQRMAQYFIGGRGSQKEIKGVDGDRSSEWIKLYSQVDLFRGINDETNIQADRVLYTGKTYEVQVINNWSGGQILEHDEVFCRRMDND